MHLLVYTCVFGQYDRVYPPVIRDENLDYVIVTDDGDLRVPGWRTHVVDGTGFPTFKAANLYHRALIHRIFPDYDASLYVDGNMRLLGKTQDVFAPFLASEKTIGMFPHPDRHSVAEEVDACVRLNKVANVEVMKREYADYLERGFPDDRGLLMTGVLLKNHHTDGLDDVMALWVELYNEYLTRDQISLPYALWKHQVTPYLFEGSNISTRSYFAVYPHYQGSRIAKLYSHLYARSHDSLLHELALAPWRLFKWTKYRLSRSSLVAIKK